jgi:hypothetical protein
VTAHLMTRGTPRRLDYRFLGTGPPQRWWGPLQEWVELEEPEVIVLGGAPGTRVLVSGVPSVRKDVIGTTIRYTLVVDDADPVLARNLAAAGLDEAGRARLGSLLDDGFPAEWVDEALAHADPDAVDVAGDVAARIASALETIGKEEPPQRARSKVRYRSWVGAVDDEHAVSAFLERVARLASGMSGWAFTTAAIASVDGAGEAAEALAAPVAVLLADGGPDEVVDLGKDPAGQPTPGAPPTKPPPQWTLRLPKVAAAVAVALAVVVGVILVLSTTTTPTQPTPAPPGPAASQLPTAPAKGDLPPRQRGHP